MAVDWAVMAITAQSTAIVCEGYTDVISMHEAGFKNCVATLGTALTIDHIRTLERCRLNRIIFMFDGDAAGQRAAERALLFMDETTADLRCVILPDDLDPADFLAERGARELAEQLEGARPLIDFVFEKRLAAFDLSVPGRRVAALDEMAGVLAPLKRSVLLDEYATRLADTLGVDVEETKRLIRSKPIPQAPRAVEPRDGTSQDASGGRGTPEPPAASARAEAAAPSASPSGASTPPDGHAVPDVMSVLSADERAQLRVERELLALMAEVPDAFRAHADRIAGFSWCDSRDQSIAWAILSTPEGTAPAEVVRTAEQVVPEAPSILAGGTLASEDVMGTDAKVSFLLDAVDLYSTRRKVRDIRSRIGAVTDSDEATRLFGEATELQRREKELQQRLSAVNVSGENRVG